METWEYETEVLRNEDMPSRQNVRGEAGWELVSVTLHKMVKATFSWNYTTTEYVAVYKRHKP